MWRYTIRHTVCLERSPCASYHKGYFQICQITDSTTLFLKLDHTPKSPGWLLKNSSEKYIELESLGMEPSHQHSHVQPGLRITVRNQSWQLSMSGQRWEVLGRRLC